MGLEVAREKRPGQHRSALGTASSGRGRRGGAWKRQRAGVTSSVRLALLRLTRGWRLLLVVALGILAAVVLVCTVPLYDTLVVDLQLQRTLNTSDVAARNLQAEVASAQVTSATRDAANPVIAQLQGQYLAGFTDPSPTYYLTSDPILALQAGAHKYNPADSDVPQLT